MLKPAAHDAAVDGGLNVRICSEISFLIPIAWNPGRKDLSNLCPQIYEQPLNRSRHQHPAPFLSDRLAKLSNRAECGTNAFLIAKSRIKPPPSFARMKCAVPGAIVCMYPRAITSQFQYQSS